MLRSKPKPFMKCAHWRSLLPALVLLSVALLFVPAPTTGTQPQPNQREIADQLLGSDLRQRNEALKAVLSIGPAKVGPELRSALITLLERQNRIVLEAQRRQVTLDTLEDPEFISGLSRVVAELKDPKAIPALAGALGMFTAIRPLADFGEQAAPAVLEVVTSAHSHYSAVNDGLITLRFMVERMKSHRLSAGILDQIRRAAEQRLSGKQYFTTLWYAIDLAVVLNDAKLRGIVKSLASNRNEVMARGIEDAKLIDLTQKRAADRIAGVPANPRP